MRLEQAEASGIGHRPGSSLGPAGAVPSDADCPMAAGVLVPFVVVMVVLLGVCMGGCQMLSAVRAFVGGESLWSKGRGAAMAQLRLYAATGAPAAYRGFEQALDAPLGDREARRAMEADEPDFERARAGLLRGGNHADDVDSLIWLYRAFGDTFLLRDAVRAWREGDALIDELQAVGEDVRSRLDRGGRFGDAELARLDVVLDLLEGRLQQQETRFSEALGAASRGTQRGFQLALVALTLALGMAVVLPARRALQRNERQRRQWFEAHQRWSMAAEVAGIGLFEWRSTDDLYRLDARCCALFGLDTGEEGRSLERRRLRRTLLDEDIPAMRLALDRARRDALPFRFRCRVKHPDGDVRHLETVGWEQRDDAGRVQHVVGVVHDVSEDEERTRRSIEAAAAERAARARMAFLSRLSHELRTPLNAVLGFSQLMLTEEREPLSAGAAERMQHIVAAGQHLLRLVDDVLDVTCIDSGPFSVQIEPVGLAALWESALKQVEPWREAAGVTIETAWPDDSLRVRADAKRLEQVLVNLLRNGCQYNRAGGKLAVVARAEGDEIWIDISDEGEGLSDSEIRQLFQPFQRLPRHSRVPGTGLGLVIVKLLVAQMGGQIAVRSQPGQGSTFSIGLARCDELG